MLMIPTNQYWKGGTKWEDTQIFLFGYMIGRAGSAPIVIKVLTH